MTRDAFHRLMTDPNTSTRLDSMLADNARVDADLEAARQRQRSEDIYVSAVRAWFRRTDPRSEVA